MDPKTGEQTSADYCFSKEDGNGCPIHCSINCGEKETLCPGKVDAAGFFVGIYKHLFRRVKIFT